MKNPVTTEYKGHEIMTYMRPNGDATSLIYKDNYPVSAAFVEGWSELTSVEKAMGKIDNVTKG